MKSIILIIALFLVILSGCNPGKVTYKELKIEKEEIEYSTHEIPNVFFATRIDNKIFVIEEEVWKIDLDKKTEQIIIKNGIGPNELYNPEKIHHQGHYVWINVINPVEYLYGFSIDAEPLILERKRFTNQIRTDDFAFISPDKVALTYVYWDDALLKVYDYKTNKIKNYSSSKKIPLMYRFNISRSSITIVNNTAYITQSILPEIQVIPLDEKKENITSIHLSPPFYKAMPEKYIQNSNDNRAHKRWMASWTSIFNINSYGDWILVTYKYGYDFEYCYELFNLKNTKKRYYLNNLADRIYEFRVMDQTVEFRSFESLEESTLWKKLRTQLN